MATSSNFMLHRVLALVALAAAATAVPAEAPAKSKSKPAPTDVQTCDRASGDAAISACTRAIDSGRLSGRNLAILYINRAAEFGKKREHARAIADFDKAIGLDAKY